MNQAIRVNDTIQMVCTSEGGNPLAQVAWYLGNAQVDFSYITRGNKAENELIITAQRSDNDAVYRCEAWNKVNSDAPLTVERKILVHCRLFFIVFDCFILLLLKSLTILVTLFFTCLNIIK